MNLLYTVYEIINNENIQDSLEELEIIILYIYYKIMHSPWFLTNCNSRYIVLYVVLLFFFVVFDEGNSQ